MVLPSVPEASETNVVAPHPGCLVSCSFLQAPSHRQTIVESRPGQLISQQGLQIPHLFYSIVLPLC